MGFGSVLETNNKKKLIYIISAILLVLLIMIHIPFFSNIVVVLFEKLIIRRPSANAYILIAGMREMADAYVGVFIIILITLVANHRKDLFFVAINLYAFVISLSGVWRDTVFNGYMAEWDYSDFTAQVLSGYGDIYGTNYPPLAVCVFKFFNGFVSNKPYTVYVLNFVTYIFMIGTFLCIFGSFLFLFCRNKEYFDVQRSFLFSTIVMFMGPMLFCYQRLNLVVLSVALIGVFLLLYESENMVQKHIALLSLAIAANIKYYPAIYGVMLLRKKKWKDAIIAFVEGITLFILPMFIEKIMNFKASMDTLVSENSDIAISHTEKTSNGVSNLIAASTSFADGSRSLGYSIKGIVTDIYSRLGFATNTNGFRIVYILALAIVLITAIIGALISKRDDFALALLGFLCIFVPAVSYFYATAFLLFPMAILIRNTYKKDTLFDTILLCMYLFLMVFAYKRPPIYPHIERYIYMLVIFFVVFGKIIFDFVNNTVNEARR